MDRHQFVQGLIEKRDEAAKTLEELKKESAVAHSRTRTAIAKLLAAPDQPTVRCVNSTFSFSIGGCPRPLLLAEAEMVSDEAIISLCGEICSLRKQCDDEREKTEKYKLEDVVTTLKQILATVPG